MTNNNNLTIDDVFVVSLTSTKGYKQPFRDVTVSAIFSGPQNEIIEIPAQFKTDKWVIQFKPYIVGTWHYTTKCTDTSNTCLHNVDGNFEVSQERERKLFKVEDYDAKPNSTQNSKDAIQNAIDAASQYTKETGLYAEVRLKENAVYRVGILNGNDCIHALNISDAKNIKFNGQGAELVFTNNSASGIAVKDCENIVLLNFKIDYDPLPYAPGYIVDIDYENATFDLKIDEGCIELDNPAYAIARGVSGITKTFEGGTTKYGPTIVSASIYNKIGDRLWRIDANSGPFNGYKDPIKSLKVGARYSHNAQTWGSAVGILNSINVRCEGVVLYASPGLAFYGLAIENITFRDCHVKPKDENRVMSTGADGMHLRSLRGCLIIDGCSFEGMPDDGINIHSSALVISKVISSRQIEVYKHTFDIREGDRVVVMNSANGIARAESIVTKVEDIDALYIVTLDRAVEGMVIKSEGEAPDKLYNLDSCGTSFVIRRNIFNSHRCRDVLLSTQFGIVEDNVFNNEDGWGVVLFHETYWWNEGPIASDVIIRNNVFNGRSKATIAAIYSYIQLPEGKGLSKVQEFKNLLIENNTFNNMGKAIDLSSAQNVQILNNTINNTESMQRYGDSYSTISLNNCKEILIDGLNVIDENNNLSSIIKISNDCGLGDDGVKIEKVTKKVGSKTQCVADER